MSHSCLASQRNSSFCETARDPSTLPALCTSGVESIRSDGSGSSEMSRLNIFKEYICNQRYHVAILLHSKSVSHVVPRVGSRTGPSPKPRRNRQSQGSACSRETSFSSFSSRPINPRANVIFRRGNSDSHALYFPRMCFLASHISVDSLFGSSGLQDVWNAVPLCSLLDLNESLET